MRQDKPASSTLLLIYYKWQELYHLLLPEVWHVAASTASAHSLTAAYCHRQKITSANTMT